jgi:hypothetical protein
MNKYEQLIEHIINDETDKARALFHNIVVEKSRDIYESLIDETDLDEVGGNHVQGLVDEITIDEQGISEEEEEEGSFDQEEAGEDEFGAEEHGEAEIEDRVVDLEAALDELKAEFDALMADEENETEHHDGMEDPDFSGEEHGEEDQSEFYEATDEDDEEALDESIVREYVEKVGDTGQRSPSGKMSGTGSHSENQGERNTKSAVAGKNDMGGSSANIARGGANQNPNGTTPHPTAKPKGELIGKVLNTPGAAAGKTAFKSKQAATGQTSPTGKMSGTGINTPKQGETNIKSPLAR